MAAAVAGVMGIAVALEPDSKPAPAANPPARGSKGWKPKWPRVTFPMFEKISVLGADQHPLYRQLASQPAPIGGDPSWNFTKFLVDRTGNVVARFEPKTKPDDPALVKKFDELLAAK